MLFQVNDICKSYESDMQRRLVINHVSFNVEEGSFLGIHGPSGSGKTTLLYCLSALETLDTGDILFNNTSMTHLNDDQLSSLRKYQIGFIFQFFHLIPQLTAYENIMLANVIAGRNEPDKVIEVLKWVNMDAYKDYFPTQLSGGMQQRVAIARALINEPKVLFADEPTGNLDQKQGIEIMTLLKRLNEEKGLTIILVTHNEDYLKYCTQNLKLIDGEVVDEDKY